MKPDEIQKFCDAVENLAEYYEAAYPHKSYETERAGRNSADTAHDLLPAVRAQLSAASPGKCLENLRSCVTTASAPGNVDANPYLWGMANGLICALAVMTNTEPQYADKPERWLDDAPLPGEEG